MSNLVPAEKRILMKDFPLAPGDIVLMQIDDKPRLGRVEIVYSRNPDPGQTVPLKTREEFEEHVGGTHASVHLKYYDSMWVLILFVAGAKLDARWLHTYEIREMMDKNELAKIDPANFFDNYLNIALHN